MSALHLHCSRKRRRRVEGRVRLHPRRRSCCCCCCCGNKVEQNRYNTEIISSRFYNDNNGVFFSGCSGKLSASSS